MFTITTIDTPQIKIHEHVHMYNNGIYVKIHSMVLFVGEVWLLPTAPWAVLCPNEDESGWTSEFGSGDGEGQLALRGWAASWSGFFFICLLSEPKRDMGSMTVPAQREALETLLSPLSKRDLHLKTFAYLSLKLLCTQVCLLCS